MHPSQLTRIARAAVLAASVLVAFASAACHAQPGPSAGSPAPLVTIRVANLGVAGTGPQQLAIENGTFARHGIDLQVVNFPRGGAEATAGVASGWVDMGEYGSPILMGVASGLHIRIVGSPPIKENPFELVARKGIESVRDLKGKVVASGELGGGSHQSVLKILHDNGLTEDDVKVLASSGINAEALLRSGRVDAVVTGGQVRNKLIAESGAKLIARARDYYGRYQHSYVFATDDFIKAHPEAIRNYFLATREAFEYARTHLDELVAFTASRVKLPKDIIRATYQEQIAQWDLSFAVDLEGTANAVKILKQLKEIKQNVTFDPDTWLDLRFLN